METFRLPPTACPACKKKLDAATDSKSGKKSPRPFDLSVCIGCGEILIYTFELNLRKITDAELKALDVDTLRQLLRVKLAIKEVVLRTN